MSDLSDKSQGKLLKFTDIKICYRIYNSNNFLDSITIYFLT